MRINDTLYQLYGILTVTKPQNITLFFLAHDLFNNGDKVKGN